MAKYIQRHDVTLSHIVKLWAGRLESETTNITFGHIGQYSISNSFTKYKDSLQPVLQVLISVFSLMY